MFSINYIKTEPENSPELFWNGNKYGKSLSKDGCYKTAGAAMLQMGKAFYAARCDMVKSGFSTHGHLYLVEYENNQEKQSIKIATI